MIYKNQKTRLLVFLLFLFYMPYCFAKKNASVIVIDTPTTYKNTTINLAEQSFHITNDATLDIEDCIITGIISPNNPNLFTLTTGNVILKNNTLSIMTYGLNPDPIHVSLYHVFSISQGNITLDHNHFNIDQPYVVSVLYSGHNMANKIVILNNYFEKFHGGLFISDSQNPVVENNTFISVSGSNIYLNNANQAAIENNTLLFAGRNNVGDAIDVFDSTDTKITKNYIGNDSCYSIYISNCTNLSIDQNKIVGGITYGISLSTSLSTSANSNYLALLNNTFHPNNTTRTGNFNISITNNYLVQNRFGLTATNTSGLTVSNNYFIQHFSNASDRQFWTNNNYLITNTTNMIWTNNLYKEAYSQANSDDNSLSNQYVIFPKSGGVIL